MARLLLRGLGIAVAAVGLMVVVLTARALRLPSRQIEVPPAPTRAIDGEAAAKRLAEAIRFRTISYSREPADLQAEAFTAFRAWLAASYPRLHRELALELVSDHSLVYTWAGSDATLAPILLLAHQDVVPADNADRWTHPPFAGDIEGGYVWGRGAIDDKGPLIALCEAVEGLLAADFSPRRTVVLAFGHDEEVGGPQGAQKIAALLASRGVRAALVLDEGFAVIETGSIPGLPPRLAAVAVAEKGSATLELVARAAGGHSSTPPRHTAAGILARAVARVEERPLPLSVGGVMASSVAWLAPELPLWARIPVANLGLFVRPIDWVFADQPAVNALLRTTTAVTMLSGSPKENVLPVEAIAAVNFRILPGHSAEQVLAHTRAAVDDPRIEVRFKFEPREASTVSPSDGPAFLALQRTIREGFPDAVVLPVLAVGGTDARYYGVVSENVYRFAPFRFAPADIRLPHGIDERVSIESLPAAIDFYARLIERAGALEAP
jgi:carboxypeptidase PM20D1